MVIPAMEQLRRVLTKDDTSDSDRIKAALAILNRTGYPDRHSVDLGLRESTPFDDLTNSAFVVMRGRENVIDGTDGAEALSSGGGEDDEALGDFLDARDRAKQREASTKLDNSGHEVVAGDLVEPDADLFGYPLTREQRYRKSGRSEHDPDGTRPEGEPWEEYERRVTEGLD